MFDPQTRRQFLNTTGMGLGSIILGDIAAQATATKGGVGNAYPQTYHLPKAPAKRVIFLFMIALFFCSWIWFLRSTLTCRDQFSWIFAWDLRARNKSRQHGA